MLVRYLLARLRHPAPSAKRFIHAGLGLESRANLLSTYWTDHFSRSRAAQARWAKTVHGELLTVLGAGPLLDFNNHALARKFQRFRLVDANPLLLEKWRVLNKPIDPVITDTTNCVSRWAESLKSFSGDWPATLSYLENLANTPAPAYAAASDAVLSLNIVSQLEIGWQETVEPILKRRFGRRFVSANEQGWLTALRPSSQVLVEQHLLALNATKAGYILLITDIEYAEYTGRHYNRRHREDPPLRWDNNVWHSDHGIKYELTPALEGVALDQATFQTLLPSYQLDWHESWLWHIAPNGTETTKFGRLHRVGAFAFSQRLVATG